MVGVTRVRWLLIKQFLLIHRLFGHPRQVTDDSGIIIIIVVNCLFRTSEGSGGLWANEVCVPTLTILGFRLTCTAVAEAVNIPKHMTIMANRRLCFGVGYVFISSMCMEMSYLQCFRHNIFPLKYQRFTVRPSGGLQKTLCPSVRSGGGQGLIPSIDTLHSVYTGHGLLL